MGFELGYALRGSLREELARKRKPIATAITRGQQEVAKVAKADYRAQVKRNFKRTPPYAKRYGQDIDKSTGATAYPNRRGRVSVNAVTVFKATPAFMEKFTQGGYITRRGPRLVVALPTAKRKTLERSFQPSRKGGGRFYRKYSDIKAARRMFGKLRRIPLKGGDYLLAADAKRAARKGLRPMKSRGRNFVPLFLVRRFVTVPKKFDFEGPLRRGERDLPGLVNKFYRDPQ